MSEGGADTAGEIFRMRLNSRRAYVGGGVAVLLVVSLLLGGVITFVNKRDDSAVWFISLLVIFMTAMATTAVVFKGLKLGSAQEAFGLPSGSIRALLAIGIMVLFVVFGLSYVGQNHEGEVLTQVTKATVPFDQLQAERELYERRGFVVVVTKPGKAASGEGTTATAAEPAELTLYRSNAPSAASQDLVKQLLTAIITLLTTVIGFYFGSRTAVESRKEEGAGPPAAPASSLVVDRNALGKDLEAVTGELTPLAQRLQRVAQAPDLADPLEQANRKTQQATAEAAGKALEDLRAAAAKGLDDYDKEAAALAAGPQPDALDVHRTNAADAIKAARTAIEQIRAGLDAYKRQVEALEQLTAES